MPFKQLSTKELLEYCDAELQALQSSEVPMPIKGEIEMKLLLKARKEFPNHKLTTLALEANWERLHLDKCSEVESLVRKRYAVAGVLRAASLLHDGKQDSHILKEALVLIDKVLLMGPGENFQISQFASNLHMQLDCNLETDLTLCQATESLSEDVERVKKPSLQWFLRNAINAKKPFILTGCIDDWPAMAKWRKLNYFYRIARYRLVPVEIGKDYMDEKWTQTLMFLGDFMDKYIIGSTSKKRKLVGDGGYMAQHEIFNQIFELKKDIRIPDYCSLTESDGDTDGRVAINMWFGPKGTASRLHYDPKKNLLAQIIGSKKIKLAPPECTEYLYPFKGMMENTSQIDLEDDHEINQLFPSFSKVNFLELTLQPGEM